MLRYVSVGERAYGEHPWAPHTRHSWEFQAVLSGRCAAWLPGRRVWRERTLWLFPPDCIHGWIGEPGATCRVCVIHVPTVPDLLRVLAEERGHLEVALDDASAARLEAIAARAGAIAAGDPRAGLLGDAVLAELALLVADRLPPALLRRFAPAPDPERLVADALAWYAERMAESPGVAEIAQAMRVSPAHLRRLFMRVRGESPLAACTGLRLRRIDELARDRTLTLAGIARLTGFASASALSHAYHAARGVPPGRVAGRRRA